MKFIPAAEAWRAARLYEVFKAGLKEAKKTAQGQEGGVEEEGSLRVAPART